MEFRLMVPAVAPSTLPTIKSSAPLERLGPPLTVTGRHAHVSYTGRSTDTLRYPVHRNGLFATSTLLNKLAGPLMTTRFHTCLIEQPPESIRIP